jgi:hypothetical protein
MAGKYETSNLLGTFFNLPEQEYMENVSRDYSEKENEKKLAEMEGRKMAMGSGSSAIWIISGLLVTGLLVFIVLKKKKII